MEEAVVDSLGELFPSLPRDLLVDVLHEQKNIDNAVTRLLQLTDGSAQRQHLAASAPSTVQTAAVRGGAVQVGRARPSWGTMGLSADLREKLQLGPPSSQNAAASRTTAAQDFPPAVPSAGHAPTASSCRGGPAATTACSTNYARTAAAGPGVWAAAAAAAPFAPATQPVTTAVAGEQQWRQEVVEQLRWQHPWAGSELVSAVLSAVDFDLDTAEAILADMATPAASDGEALPGPDTQAITDKAAGTFAEGWSGCDDPSSPAEQPDDFLAADDDFVVAGAAAPRRPRVAPRASAAEPTSLNLRPPPASQQPGGGISGSSGGGGDSTDDVYWRHRGEAQRLTRDWQRAVAKAAAAYCGGSRARAAQLAAEAQRLRGQSLAAHERAASEIEAELNASGSLFELDLHGLHASEAVAALDRRLSLLQDVLRDATVQPQGTVGSGAGKQGGGGRQALRAGGSLGLPPEARPGMPMLPAGPAGPSVLPAAGRLELRVVVGRGVHSSGGEASIPRAVEARLVALGYQFARRTGALDVQLRRPFGGQRAALEAGR